MDNISFLPDKAKLNEIYGNLGTYLPFKTIGEMLKYRKETLEEIAGSLNKKLKNILVYSWLTKSLKIGIGI